MQLCLKINYNNYLLVLFILFGFVPYTLVAHKEMRFLIAVLPFLYILTSYGILNFAGLFKKKKNLIFSLLIIIFLILNLPKLEFSKYEDSLDLFYDYIEMEDVRYGLWISNPAMVAYSDTKVSELIYYPLFNSEKIDYLVGNLDDANYVLINSCDLLPCPPVDNDCPQKNKAFIDLLNEELNLNLYMEGILEAKTSPKMVNFLY